MKEKNEKQHICKPVSVMKNTLDPIDDVQFKKPDGKQEHQNGGDKKVSYFLYDTILCILPKGFL